MRAGDNPPSDDIKTLLQFYKDNVVYQRHHEDIRFKGSQLIVTLAGALIAAIKCTNSGRINYSIALFVILLGTLGIAQVLKHTERADRHALIAREYRRKIGEISEINGATSAEKLHDSAAEAHKAKAGFTYRMRATWFWICMHLAVIVIGATVLFFHHKGPL
jgi:hypothetical protein